MEKKTRSIINKIVNSKKFFIFITVVPSLCMTAFFKLWPSFQVFKQSFYKVTSLGLNSEFIGLGNYIKLFKDKMFIASLKNTLKLILLVPIPTLLLALVLAFVLTQSKLKEASIYRTVLFFPSVLSMVVIGTVWANAIYHPNGLFNKILGFFNVDPVLWLVDKKTVIISIAIVLIWQAVGYYMVMYIAGIDGISPEIYEAAMIDGAGSITKIFRITLPLIWNVIRVTIIFSISGVLNLGFTIPVAMAIPAAPKDWNVLLAYMYTQAFELSNFGYAMAISVTSLVLALTLSLFSYYLQREE